MASTHKHLRSGTADKRPTTSIAEGQIALNTNATSPGLFFKDSTGATIIKVGPVHVGTTAPNATPPAGGSSGNSIGEVWLDTSLTPVGVKIWSGVAWVNATPSGSTTVQGLLELATNAETQAGSDTARAVTPASLQSKVSDSVSTTSSTTIASSTAVKAAYDLAAAAVPAAGGVVTGNLEIGTTGSLTFEGSVADGFETTLGVVNPTADRSILLPNVSGTVVTTGDTGSVTSAMIADGTIVSSDIASGTIVDANISATAEIAVSKLADGSARQLLQTDSTGNNVEWTSNVDIPGTLDVTSTATFDSIASIPAGSAAAPTLTFTGDTNTGLYSPGADQVALATGGVGRLFVDASGRVSIGTSAPTESVHTTGALRVTGTQTTAGTGIYLDQTAGVGNVSVYGPDNSTQGTLRIYTATANGGTGSAKLVVDSSGRVGIGTTSPGYSLDVRPTGLGLARFGSQDNQAGIYISSGNAASPFINFLTSTSTLRATIYAGAASDDLIFGTGASGTERARIDSSGRLLVGTSTARSTLSFASVAPSIQLAGASTSTSSLLLHKYGNDADACKLILLKNRGANADSNGGLSVDDPLGVISFEATDGFGGSTLIGAEIGAYAEAGHGSANNDGPTRLVFSTTKDEQSSPTEAMRIDRAQNILIGTTSTAYSLKGVELGNEGYFLVTRDGAIPMWVNRLTTDGVLIELAQGSTVEGSISVSGTTVSYNGAHLSRWSQLSGIDPYDKTVRPEILRGTVMSNLDDMCDWTCPTSGDCQDNEQLNKTKISDVEGDKNVAGVFQSWDDDDDTWVNDFYLAMTGDFVIRIAAGTTVQRGDLLMSAGDGTAKPQDDDIIRSKTIAKVTSTNVSCTHPDGSYCVPCVLMAC